MSTLGGFVRAFIAIDVPSEVRQIMAVTMRELADQIPGSVRWVDPQGIHLTLKFLGDIPAQDVEHIVAALKTPVRQVPGFSIHLTGLGMFPNNRRPRVLWAGVDGQLDTLTNLQQCVEGVLSELNYATERQTFSPHLTLGRVRERISPGARRRIIQAMSSASIPTSDPWLVKEIRLFRTTLTPQGSIHTSMGVVPMAGG
ncbi:MAG: 2'-5' RNA ligase [SAR202 cluster bacterium Io17-Chloro-G2]|nr:MAG: 2'-5' RNA ligase [SAR202 cluster bacterium Io17-Chloro-G2]